MDKRRGEGRRDENLVFPHPQDQRNPSSSSDPFPSPHPLTPSFPHPPESLPSRRGGLLNSPWGSTSACSTRSPSSTSGISSSNRESPLCILSFLFPLSISSYTPPPTSYSPGWRSSSARCRRGSFDNFFLTLRISMTSALKVAVLMICCSGFCQGIGSPKRTILALEDILPEKASSYDKMVPPKVDGQPTVVHFHVTVMSIDSINENSMSYGRDIDIYSENTVSSISLQSGEYSGTFVADIFFAQTWKDHRLRLPVNMTAEYRLLDLDWLSHLWRPDSFFKNAKEVNFQTMTIPNHYMWLYKDFTLLYMVKLTLTLSCAMNFAIYPHDTQECNMQMESLSHTTDDLIFEWDPDVPLVVDEGIELPQQMIISNTTAECTQVYSTGNFTCLEVVFKLKRRLGHFLFHTYIPTCLIVIMSWVSFWIRPEIAPARVTLGVTSLLTLSTQFAKSQSALPPVSYIKAIDVFMSSCTVFVFMALMEYAVVNVILGDEKAHRAPKRLKIPPPPPPPDLRAIRADSLFLKEMASKLGGDIPRIPDDILNRPSKKSIEAKERRARAIMMDRGSRYVFPIAFAVLNCIYWITFWEYL